MSDVAQGPGWWIASDGKWYPPEEHPDRSGAPEAETVAPEAETDAGASSADVMAAAMSVVPLAEHPRPSEKGRPPVMITGEGQVFDPVLHVREASSRRFWVLGAVVLVVLAVVCIVVALRSPAPTGRTLAPGPSTASIEVTVPHTGHPSFTGTLAGRPLSGVVTGSGESSNSINGGPIAEYKGNLGDVPFDLHVSINPVQTGQISFGVTGTYGSEPVKATARFGLASSSARALSVPFDGHVGSQEITGVATATPIAGNGVQIRATMSVLGSAP